MALILAKMRERLNKPLLIVLPTEQEAEKLSDDLRALGFNAATLPFWVTIPYRAVAHNSPLFGIRMKVLDGILDQSIHIVCSSVRNFLTPLTPPEYIRSKYIQIRKGQAFDPQKLLRQLAGRGYMRVKRVSVASEFALRGEVCDVFMPGDEYPLRMVFDWNGVEQIRRFDASSQSSTEDLEEITIRPSREIIWDDETLDSLKKNLELLPELRPRIDEIIEGWVIPQKEGHERYFPLAFKREDSASIVDYFGGENIVCIGEYERCRSAEGGISGEYEAMYHKLRRTEPVAMPQRLLFSLEERENSTPHLLRLPLLSGIQPREQTPGKKGNIPSAAKEIHFNSDGPRSFFGNINFFKEEMSNLIEAGYEVFLFVDSDLQQQRLEQLLKDLPITILTDSISSGFSIPGLSLMVIHENELFGRKRRIPQSLKKTKSEIIDSFVELDEGDYVVHLNHGIGRFIAIQRISAGGK